MVSEEIPTREVEKPDAENPFRSQIGEITMMTDHIPTREEVHEAKKQQLRDLGMIL